MKKLFALLMAVTLTFQLVTPVFAEDTEQANIDTLPQETEVLVDETKGPDETEGPGETEKPTEADAPTAATETDKTGAAETVPTEAEPSEESSALIRVTFIRTPADLTLTVYAADTDTEIDPQKDDTYLLAPGEYTYLAELDGYISEENTFTVSEVDEANREISVKLQSADMEDDASFDSGDYSLQLSRIDELYERIKKNGGFFTVNQKGCGIRAGKSHPGCDNCYLLSIVNSNWFSTEFGSNVTCNKFAMNKGGGAKSCTAFASFAGWFVNRGDDNDSVSTASKEPGDFSFAFFSSCAKPGDSILMVDGERSHNAIFISCTEQGIYVLDSNYAEANGDPFCEVRKHTIRYSAYRKATISHLQSNQGGHTQQTAPAAPTNFKAVYVDNARAKLSWSASSGATSYEVQYWSVGSNAWKTDTSYSSGTSYTSTGLKNYSSWTFRVRAVNSAGKSDWVSCNYEKTHTHSYKQEFEAAHPHKVYMKCSSCGDWYYTGATTTVDSCTQCHPPVQQVYLDLKGYLDGRDSDSLENFGTCDVYINDVKVADDCTDFYRAYPVGTKYSIKDIRATDGHKYIGEKPFVDEDGNTSIRFEDDDGTISGTLKKNTEVVLEFETTSHGGKCGDNLTWTLDGNGTLTISGSGAMSNFSIYQNVAPWLENWDKIARVVVEPGVTSIGGNAFQRCSSLSSVRIPESVTSIGDSAFSGCSGLTSITIPEGVASIGNSAFYGCSSMTSVTIPEAVTSIGNGAFWGCSSLTSVKIPESVTSIEGAAFRGCSSLTSITIPEGVESIGSYAFQGCSSLSSITIPEAVTSIEGSAFQGCSSLTSIMIPEGVESIGSYAFSGCSGLSEVHLSNSVSSIGEKAFDGCNNLADVFYSGTEQQWNSIQISENNTCLTNARLHFNSAEVISGSCGKNLTWAITEDGVLKISGTGEMQDYEWCEDGETVYSSAPWGRMGITGLELGEGITRIGECAFLDCADISGDLILPRTLKQIGECAFSGCYGLTGVLNFPENLEEIESCAFQGCYGLYGTLQLPSKISYIGGAAFNGCSGFTGQLEIPMNVQRIDDWAFLDCSGLTNVSILGEVATIGNVSFGGCSSLESVSISEGTVNIGSCAFAECTALESIFIPKSVETIDESAFKVCDNLKNVNYGGAKTDWNQIQIAKGNTSLLNATIHYQIQSAPEIRPVDASTLDGGATLKLTLWSIDQDKQIGAAWSLAEGSEAYASITASGTLTAKAVIQPVEITVIAQPTNGEPTATKTIRITPKATALLLMRDGEVLGETLNADMYDLQALTLTAIKNTMEEAQGIHWSTSAKTVAQVDAKGLVTLLKPGRAVIQATDSGKLTGKVTLNVTYTDKSPRLEATTMNLNTALSGGVTVDFVEAYGNGVEALQWNDARFLFEYQENRLTVSAKDALKNGTYPVSLTAACSDGRTYEYPLTLKVTNTLPKVTVKQTAKLNLFYRDSRAPLVISAPGQRIENAELTDTGDFALENTEEGWEIVCTTDSPKPDTKGTLNLYLEGYREPVKAALNIGTVSTAPRAKLSATSSTVNSGSDLTTQVKLLDNSGKPLELEAPTVVCENASVSVDGNLLTITLDEAKSTTVTLYLQDSTWARSMKLTHKITVSNKTPTLKPAGSLTLSSLFTARTAETAMVLSQSNLTLVDVEAAPTAKAGTSALAESEKLRVAYDPETGHMVAAIRDPGNTPKAGTYSFACTGTLEDGKTIPGGTLRVTVSAAAPKIKLSATSVKLNQYLAGEEQGRVRVTAPSGYQVADFTGKPEGMSFDGDTGMLTVTLEDASHKGGTYTLCPLVRDVETGEEVPLPTKLSFQVRAYNSKKLSVSLSAKGKLDTQRDGEIAYTVTKLTNCLGTVENVDLVGQDGDLFQADMDLVNGKPTVHLTLVSGSTYATNRAYKIQLRFYACGKEILSPVQTVKVTQTALKVTAPKTVTYYQAQKAPLRVALTTNLPMDTVALNSKTAKEFQSALGEVTLNGNRVEFEIANPAALTAGKSYSVILDATPENNAKNGKPVTVKLTVKVRK